MNLDLAVTSNPKPEDVAAIGVHLTAYNDADVGASERTPLVVTIRGENGQLLAGISGYTAWGWLYVQWLWVDESLRGQKMASRMLTAAEGEASMRGCHSAWIDTFNPVAEKAYRRQGYEVFGELPNFPIGRTRKFLSKSL